MTDISVVWRGEVPRGFACPLFESLAASTSGKPAEQRVYRNVGVIEARSKAEALGAAAEFLTRNQQLLQQVNAVGGSSVLDFGLFLVRSGTFAPSLQFDQPILEAASGASVSLMVSCYPVCEEPPLRRFGGAG